MTKITSIGIAIGLCGILAVLCGFLVSSTTLKVAGMRVVVFGAAIVIFDGIVTTLKAKEEPKTEPKVTAKMETITVKEKKERKRK
jgi:hypothetical protein